MTLDELLEMSASQLEALTDKQLYDFFAPKFNVTRPEYAKKPELKNGKLVNTKETPLQMKIKTLDPQAKKNLVSILDQFNLKDII